LARATEDGTRVELIAGASQLTRERSFFHQYALTALASALYRWSVEFKQGVTVVQPRLIFSSGDTVVPDVVWMSRSRLRDRGLDRDGNIHQPPELIAEVLSPGTGNTRYDRQSKRHLYATHKVEEYWIVDLEAQVVDVHRLQTNAWRPHVGELTLIEQIDREHTVMTPLLPLFQLKVASLFPTLIPRA
jgi:Uma2 family endonuclease